jgi:hypothetical protein
VICVRGDGAVLFDGVLDEGAAHEVEPLTELVVVQADAALPAPGDDGMPGWHLTSRLARVGASTALAAGCVLHVETAAPDRGTSWAGGGDVTAGADTVTTHFSRPARCVVVVVESEEPDRLGDLGLELSGARRVMDAHGALVPPTLIVNGVQSIAVYPVEPDPLQPTSSGPSVRFVTGGGWRVTGVLASGRTPERASADLRRFGVAAATARLLAVDGPGCRPEWKAGR